MAIVEFISKRLLSSGLVFNTLLADMAFLAIVIVLVYYVITPGVISYAKFKDIATKVGRPDDGHWLYGDIVKYSFTAEGLERAVKRCREFPSMCAQWLGPISGHVQVYHPETVKSVLSKIYPKGVITNKVMKPLLREGLLTSSGALWKRHRRLLTPIFHFDVLKQHVVIFNQNCESFLKWIDDKASYGDVGDICVPISEFTYSNLMECVMSQQFNDKSGKGSMYVRLVRELSAGMLARTHHSWMLIDFLFWLSPEGRKFKRNAESLMEMVGEIIQERKKVLFSNNSESSKITDDVTGKIFTFRKRKNKFVDFLDILIQTKDQDGVGLTEDEITDEVLTFFSAGQETVATSLSWILYHLSNNPECQEKCRDEIRNVVGDKETIEWDDLAQLPYLNQCIKEGIRVQSVIHITARKVTDELTIKNSFDGGREHVFKKGTGIGINFHALHHNPHVWENPDVFDPDRFSPENSENRSPFAFLPFGAGTRNCIGQNFAMQQMRVVLCKVLRSFHVYRDCDTKEAVVFPAVTILPRDGVHLKFRHVVP